MGKIILLTVVALVLASLVTNSQIPTDYIGHWKFEGNANDESTNSNDGVPSPSVSYVAGLNGQSIELNGIDGYIDLGDPEIYKTSIGAISLWFKTSSQNGQVLFSRSRSDNDYYHYMVLISSDGKIGVFAETNGVTGSEMVIFSTNTESLNDGEWHNIIVSVPDAASINLYIDGQGTTYYIEEGTVSDWLGDVPDATTSQFQIGVLKRPSDFWYFNGQIDDVYLYDRGLVLAEAVSLYEENSGMIPSPSDVWTMNTDSTIYYNDGNVGIGTDDPQHPLHIFETSEHNGTTLFLDAELSKNPDLMFATNGVKQANIKVADTEDEQLQFGVGPDLDVAMSIATDGKVGIGITDPTRGKLVVQQSSDASDQGIELLNSTGQRAMTLWTDATD